MKHWGIVLLLCLGIVACSSDKKIAPKEGRIGLQENVVIPTASQKIQLAKTSEIALVNTPNYDVQNKRPHLKKIILSTEWKISGAEGKNKNTPSLPAPIIGKENVYTLDGKFVARAHKKETGEILWKTPLSEDEAGLSLVKEGTLLIALSAKGKVVALNTDGKILWQKDLNAPFRNVPVLEKNNLYLVSANNDVWVLNPQKGQEKWHYKTDAPMTFLQQMGTPAVSKNTIVVPFSSGLNVAFDKTTGAYLWEEEMNGNKTFDRISTITQMTASPVIDGTNVYLVGHADKTGAYRLSDGQEIWSITHGGQLTPLINGNAFFMLTNQNELLALNKSNGHLFWQQGIPEIQGKKAMVLLDDKIMIVGTERSIILNAKTGKIEDFIETNFDGSIPVVTQDGWYYLRKDGKLIHQGQIQ